LPIDHNQDYDIIQIYDYQPITKNFSRHYLQSDGIVIMRLLDMNIDLVTMNDLMDDLWEFYKVDPL
jgi:hypothetical protein